MRIIIKRYNEVVFDKNVEKTIKIELERGNYTMIFMNEKGDKLVRRLSVDSPLLLEVSISGKMLKQAVGVEEKEKNINKFKIVIVIILIAIVVLYLNFDKIKEFISGEEWR